MNIYLAGSFKAPSPSLTATPSKSCTTYPERIRLSAIDCPEKGQAFGTRVRQAASALVFGKVEKAWWSVSLDFGISVPQ